MLRLFNASDKPEEAGQFIRWVKAGGKVAPGLVKRRNAEKAWFFGEPIPRMEIFGEQAMTRAIDNPDPWYTRALNYYHTL